MLHLQFPFPAKVPYFKNVLKKGARKKLVLIEKTADLENQMGKFLRYVKLLLCLLLGIACYAPTMPQANDLPSAKESVSVPDSRAASSPPQKHALIVAISHYDPSTNWWDISSENDVPLIKNALKRHGFPEANIHVIPGSSATKTGIVEGVKKHLLGPSIKKGDVVVFHYSGHGQQITDDDENEELDGYDEALVPYDAPHCPSMKKKDGVCVPDGKYTGEKHLRDDEMNILLQQLRERVGPEGNVVVFLDSCFSGSGTRGEHTATARGTDLPIGYPAMRETRGSKSEEAGGFDEITKGARGGTIDGEGALSPYVVFSAARHDQLAFETTTEDETKTKVGSLSYSLHKALSEAKQATSYRALFGKIESTLKGRVDNHPQVEGHVDRPLFSGLAIDQSPFIEVEVENSQVFLKAGSLAGLFRGTQVAFHKGRPDIPTPETKIGEGTVDSSEPLKAFVRVEDGVPIQALQDSSAFVTAYAFGDLHIGVQLKSFVDTDVRQEIEEALSEKGIPVIMNVSEDEADVRIWERSNQDAASPSEVIVEDAKLGISILKALPITTRNLAGTIQRKLENFAYGRYLRKLEIKHDDFPAKLEIVPVMLTATCRGSSKPNPETCVERELPLNKFLTRGNNLELSIGTWFQLKVHLPNKEMYVTIVDIWSDGTIAMLWPPPLTGDKTKFPVGHKKIIPALYQIGEPEGSEVFLLVATEEYVNLEPFATPDNLRSRGSKDNLGPFAPLFELKGGTRGTATSFSPGKVTTNSILFTVTKNK